MQVAALMVMEFLIATPEITEEISQALEMPKVPNVYTKSIRNQNKLLDSGV